MTILCKLARGQLTWLSSNQEDIMNNKTIKNPQTSSTPLMKTIHEASVETGLSYYFLRQLCIQNKIVYIKSGKKYYINMRKLAEYLDSTN